MYLNVQAYLSLFQPAFPSPRILCISLKKMFMANLSGCCTLVPHEASNRHCCQWMDHGIVQDRVGIAWFFSVNVVLNLTLLKRCRKTPSLNSGITPVASNQAKRLFETFVLLILTISFTASSTTTLGLPLNKHPCLSLSIVHKNNYAIEGV